MRTGSRQSPGSAIAAALGPNLEDAEIAAEGEWAEHNESFGHKKTNSPFSPVDSDSTTARSIGLRASRSVYSAHCTARRGERSCKLLLSEIWGTQIVGLETVRSHVCKARSALRAAIKKDRRVSALRSAIQEAGLRKGNDDDPIPFVDRGTENLAWQLILP